MQCVERLEAKAIGGLEIMKQLSHELWRSRVLRIRVPLRGIHQIVRSGKFRVSVWCRLIENDLRARRINNAATHQFEVHIMEPHGALVGSTYAAESKSIVLVHGLAYIFEAFGSFSDLLEKSSLLPLLFWR